MLILLTLSFLPSSNNSTADLISRGVNLVADGKKTFKMLLNDTKVMDTERPDLKIGKTRNTLDKPIDQIARLLNEHFNTSPNAREYNTTGNILQGDAHYNTPTQSRPMKHPRLVQKHQKNKSRLNRPAKDLKKTTASEKTLLTTDAYYNTPPAFLGVDNLAILKHQFGIEDNDTQRKTPRYFVRSHRNKNNHSISHKDKVSHGQGVRKREIRRRVTDTTLSSVEIQQNISIFYNPAQEEESYQRKWTKPKKHIRLPPIITKTKILLDVQEVNETLVETDQAVPDAYDDEDETVKESSVSPNLMMRSSSLAPGDILNGKVLKEQSTKAPYLEEYYKKMEANNIKYLSVAFEDLCDQLASKRQEHVKELVQHIDITVQQLQIKGRLRWLGQPMTSILRDLTILLARDSADVLQVRAMILKSLMQQRRTIVGADVNEILDYADNLIKKEDGEHLLAVMQEVKRYPDIKKNGQELCKDVIEAFETPFYHLSGTKDLEYLVKRANKAFAERFHQYGGFEEAEDSPARTIPPTDFKPSIKQRKPQNIAHPPKVLNIKKSRKTTHTVKQPSRNSQPTRDKSPSIDKHPFKEERHIIDNPLKKHHLKHKHFSRHKHSSTIKDKELSKEVKEEVEVSKGKRHENKVFPKEIHPYRSTHLYTRKQSTKEATVIRRKDGFLKPGLLMG